MTRSTSPSLLASIIASTIASSASRSRAFSRRHARENAVASSSARMPYIVSIFVVRYADDDRAAVRLELDQPFLLQLAERLADRPAADAQARGERISSRRVPGAMSPSTIRVRSPSSTSCRRTRRSTGRSPASRATLHLPSRTIAALRPSPTP